MSNISDWQDRMLRAIWRHGENLSQEVLAWMAELHDEFGEIPDREFSELWTARTFSMARSAFELIEKSVKEETGKEVTGESFCYLDYLREPELGPVGVVRIKSMEVSTPDGAEVLGAVAEESRNSSWVTTTWSGLSAVSTAAACMSVISMRSRSGNAREELQTVM